MTMTSASTTPQQSPPHGSISPMRAFARVLAFWVAYLLILVIAAVPRGMIPPRASVYGSLVWGLLAVPLLMLVTRVFTRGTPQATRSSRTVSVRHALVGLALGVLSYAALLGAIALCVAPLHISRNSLMPSASTLGVSVASTVLLAWMEELGFRGYPLRTLLAAVRPWFAHAIVAMAFAASHLAYGWPIDRIMLGVLPYALLFGASAHWSGGIAMPLGVHTAVNLSRTVMGETETPGLLRIAVDPTVATSMTRSAPLVGALTIVGLSALLFAASFVAARRRGLLTSETV